MKTNLYHFIFQEKNTKRLESLEVKALSFVEAMPTVNIFRNTLRGKDTSCSWDIVQAHNAEYKSKKN